MKIVDITKLISLLKPAACDFWYKDLEEKGMGHRIDKVLELVVKSLTGSLEGWGGQRGTFDKSIETLKKAMED